MTVNKWKTRITHRKKVNRSSQMMKAGCAWKKFLQTKAGARRSQIKVKALVPALKSLMVIHLMKRGKMNKISLVNKFACLETDRRSPGGSLKWPTANWPKMDSRNAVHFLFIKDESGKKNNVVSRSVLPAHGHLATDQRDLFYGGNRAKNGYLAA